MNYKKETIIIIINIIITTILLFTCGIPTNMEMILYHWGNHIIFIIYLITLYIAICKLNKQFINWKGFVSALICWVVKYGSDYVLMNSQEELQYSSDMSLDFIKNYNIMNDIVIKESFFKVIIQLGIITIFITVSYMMGNIHKLKLHMNKKYLILLIIMLVIYLVVIYYKCIMKENINIVGVYINPIGNINRIFYYIESTTIWLSINDLLVVEEKK